MPKWEREPKFHLFTNQTAGTLVDSIWLTTSWNKKQTTIKKKNIEEARATQILLLAGGFNPFEKH